MALDDLLKALKGSSKKINAQDVKSMDQLVKALKGADPKQIEDVLNKNVDFSYRYQHTAPNPAYGGQPIYDLTKVFPEDVYSPKAGLYYGGGNFRQNKEATDVFNAVRGKPDAEVTIYRAVPFEKSIEEQIFELENIKQKILDTGKVPSFYDSIDPKASAASVLYEIENNLNRLKTNPKKPIQIENIAPTDWVTVSPNYAKSHAEGFSKGSKILQKKVPAKQVMSEGNDLLEQGYWPFAGVAAAPSFTNPLEMLGEVASKYREKQGQAAKKLYEMTTFDKGRNPEGLAAAEMLFDPINAIPGPAGVLSGLLMLAPKKEKK